MDYPYARERAPGQAPYTLEGSSRRPRARARAHRGARSASPSARGGSAAPCAGAALALGDLAVRAAHGARPRRDRLRGARRSLARCSGSGRAGEQSARTAKRPGDRIGSPPCPAASPPSSRSSTAFARGRTRARRTPGSPINSRRPHTVFRQEHGRARLPPNQADKLNRDIARGRTRARRTTWIATQLETTRRGRARLPPGARHRARRPRPTRADHARQRRRGDAGRGSAAAAAAEAPEEGAEPEPERCGRSARAPRRRRGAPRPPRTRRRRSRERDERGREEARRARAPAAAAAAQRAADRAAGSAATAEPERAGREAEEAEAAARTSRRAAARKRGRRRGRGRGGRGLEARLLPGSVLLLDPSVTADPAFQEHWQDAGPAARRDQRGRDRPAPGGEQTPSPTALPELRARS